MNCPELHNWLQQVMDGADLPVPPDAAAHLAQCPACRELESAARLLKGGLQSMPPPQTSALLTQSIVAGILDDRRRRLRRVRRRMVLTFALAASILILMLVGWLNQGPQSKKHQSVKNKPTPDEPEMPKLVHRAEDARAAVASLTERVADQTKEQAKVLMAVANTLDLAPMATLPGLSDLEEPLDPAAQSLRQATQTVTSGIEPITNSARRAFTFFVKEMPVFDMPTRN